MSHGNRHEHLNFDQSASVHSSRTNGSTLIQISLPSTRVEVDPDQVLYKHNGVMLPIFAVYAKDIKENDLLYMIRDDKKVTERVLGVQTILRESLSKSDVRDGMIIVNNVLMRRQ